MPHLRYLYSLFLFVALVLVAVRGHAQAPAITYVGQVVNVADAPLGGVSVLLKGTATAVTTNAAGRFLLPAPVGTHVLVFDYPGHLAVEVTVQRPDTSLIVRLHSTQPRVTPRRRPKD